MKMATGLQRAAPNASFWMPKDGQSGSGLGGGEAKASASIKFTNVSFGFVWGVKEFMASRIEAGIRKMVSFSQGRGLQAAQDGWNRWSGRDSTRFGSEYGCGAWAAALFWRWTLGGVDRIWRRQMCGWIDAASGSMRIGRGKIGEVWDRIRKGVYAGEIMSTGRAIALHFSRWAISPDYKGVEFWTRGRLSSGREMEVGKTSRSEDRLLRIAHGGRMRREVDLRLGQ